MKVFISWSGPRSRFLGEALRSWLPRVIQSVKPWMSDQDIAAGARWLSEVSGQLSDTRVGIICVTPENQSNPWLLFEAGALSKSLDQTYVCPILFDLVPSQLSSPLAQFQAIQAHHDGVEKIVTTLNSALPGGSITAEDLHEAFEVWWPKLATRLEEMPPPASLRPTKRSTEEILEEIVANTREQLRRENIRLKSLDEIDARFEGLMQLLSSSLGGLEKNFGTMSDVPLVVGSRSEDLIRFTKMSPDFPSMHSALESLNAIRLESKLMTDNLIKGPEEKHNSEE